MDLLASGRFRSDRDRFSRSHAPSLISRVNRRAFCSGQRKLPPRAASFLNESWHDFGKSRRRSKSRRWWLIATLVLVAGIALGWFFLRDVDWQRMRAQVEQLNTAALIALMAALPVFGFSISLVYLIAGAKFGAAGGLAVIAGVTAFHLFATHWVTHSVLRRAVRRLLEWRQHRLPPIPPGEERTIALMVAIVPGLPYFARNYLLAASEIPLRVYFWICLPVYVARSSLVLFLGDFTTDPSGRRLLLLGSVYATKVAICAYLIARLRNRYRKMNSPPPPARATPPLKRSRPLRCKR